MEKKTRTADLCLLGAIIGAMLFFSVNTSVLFKGIYWDGGQSVSTDAMVMARGWIQGRIPYRDLFGIQGPVLYGLQMAGYGIAGRTGLFVMQIVALGFAGCFLHATIRKFYYGNGKKTVPFELLVYLLWIGTLASGNTPEVYSMPVIALFLYLGLCDRAGRHFHRIQNYLMGMLFGIACGIDMINGCLLLCLLIGLCRKKKQTDKIGKAALFLLGIFTIWLPIGVYFGMHHALREMVDATMIYGWKELLVNSSAEIWIRKCIKASPAVAVLLFEIVLSKQEKKKLSPVLLWTAVGLLLFLACHGVEWHYYSMELLFMPLLLARFHRDLDTPVHLARLFQIVGIAMTVVVFSIPLTAYLKSYRIQIIDGTYAQYKKQVESLRENVVLSEEGQILAVDLTSDFYLLMRAEPSCRYFSNQSKMALVDEQIGTNVYEYVISSDQPWLFVSARGWVEEQIGNYMLVDMITGTQDIALYQWTAQTEK